MPCEGNLERNGVSRELSLAEIFQLGYYWETKILLTAVRLDLFTGLDGKRRTGPEIAARIQAHEPTLSPLLNALVAMRLLTKDGDSYENSSVTEKYLVRHSADFIGHLLLLHDAEWENWGKLEQTIRTGQRSVDRHVFETDPDLGSNVLAVLHRIGRQSGPDFAKRLQLTGAIRMLDLGEAPAPTPSHFVRSIQTSRRRSSTCQPHYAWLRKPSKKPDWSPEYPCFPETSIATRSAAPMTWS